MVLVLILQCLLVATSMTWPAESSASSCSVNDAACASSMIQKQVSQSSTAFETREGVADEHTLQSVNPQNEDLQLALLARSTKESYASSRELDATVSSKFLGDVVDVFEEVGTGVASVGLTVGSYAGNAAMVVGGSIVEVAETTIDSLPNDIKNAANAIGNVAVSVGSAVADVGEIVATTHVNLAGDALQMAQQGVAQGVKLAGKLGDKIKEGAQALGGEIAKLGPLAAGLAQAAWEGLKALVACWSEALSLCTLLLDDQCDCDAGSHISVGLSGISVKCVFSAGGELSRGYGFSSSSSSFGLGDEGSGGRMKMPGSDYSQTPKPPGQALRSRGALKSKLAKSPRGSCESDLELAVEALVQFTPTIELTMGINGDTQVSIDGTVRASIDAMIKAEGSCAMTTERRFPRVPKIKMVCVKIACLAIMIQMVAEVEVDGVLTGTVEVGGSVDFSISGSVTLNPSGDADVDFVSPSIKHQAGFEMAASASSSARIGLGPVLMVWPLPGIPVVINPMFNLESKAQGTLSFSSSWSLEQHAAELNRSLAARANRHARNAAATNASNVKEIGMCGAAALSIYADVDIQGFGLPKSFSSVLSPDVWIEKALSDSMTKGAMAYAQMIKGPLSCIPGVGQAVDWVQDAATAAIGALGGLIPSLSLDFSTPSMQLMAPVKFFCKEVYKTPGFDAASCASELGCKSAGRPPPPMVALPPAEQTQASVVPTHTAAACHNIPMGDRFIQLGDWRIAAMDDNHLSISHKDGQTPQIWDSAGTVHNGPRTDRNAWGRPIGESHGISFGFQFIQIGKFRLGAADDDHFSISHMNGHVPIVFREDGTVHGGPVTEWTTRDRPEAAAAGITFGDKFVQIGEFRLGDADGQHFTVTHSGGQTIQIFLSDGTRHPGPRTDWTHPVGNRGVAAWTCRSLEEMAHGMCSGDFDGFGDRFIQLGEWRLAASDNGDDFWFSHKGLKTSLFLHSNGNVGYGPGSGPRPFSRPLGFPSGITFGPAFVQIGNYRLGQYDDRHFTISHRDGKTNMVFRDDGHVWPGPRTDRNMWTKSSGPPSGITFGDRFLQIGDFRLGDVDGSHFTLTHKGGQTIQIHRKDGHVFNGPQTSWHQVGGRYAQWHCGGVQAAFGTCTGITAGEKFLQLGDWRLADVDGNHFTVSHKSGQTAQIYRGDGNLFPGPNPHWGSWDLETKKPGASGRLAFGDRFIQFGNFRMGEVDANHFSISHSSGKTAQIFKADGTLHPGPRSDFGLWGRPTGEPMGVAFGDRFVQLGNFRVGDVDSEHFSVTHKGGKTMQIFRNDGTLHPGPRTDFTTFGRQMMECKVQEI